MIEIPALAERLGVDSGRIAEVMTARDREHERAGPWYIQAILAIGAWVAGCALIGFAGTLVVVTFEIREPGLSIAAVGLIFLAGGLFLLLTDADGAGIFKAQFATTLAAAGTALVAGGIGSETKSLWVAALASVVPAALVVWKVPGLMLQTLTSTLSVGLFVAAVLSEETYFPFAILSLTLAAGTALLLYPPRIELRPTSVALLFAAPLAMILTGYHWFHWASQGDEWLSRAIHMALFLWMVAVIWQGLESRDKRIELAVLAAIALAVGAILPPGGSAVLLIIALAYVLGSRLLAEAGILLEAYYLCRFYYDLHFTLLAKSAILTAVGCALLLLWAASRWIAKREAKS